MNKYLLGFLWSIFFLTFFWNYIICWVYLLMVCFFIKRQKIFLVGWCIWIFSTIVFIYRQPSPSLLLDGDVFEGEVIKTIWEDRYEISIEKELFILQSTQDISPWESILWTIWRIVPSTPFIISFKSFNFHTITRWEFDYGRWLYSKWYRGQINHKWNLIIGEEILSKSLRTWFQELIIKKYSISKEGWLLQGMIMGWRRWINKEYYQQFIDSGLVHIIAVSWSNIMMVMLLFNWLLFFVPLLYRRVLLWVIIIIYFTLCGMDSSIFRALVFAIINLLVIFYGWRISFIRLLTYTLTILLLYNPLSFLYDLGFLLSIFALLGIYIGSKYFYTWKWFIDHYILPSISASLWVTPIILLFVWKYNILSPLTTIVLWPLLSPITVLWSLSLFIHSDLVLAVSKFLLDFIYKLSSYWQRYGVYIIIDNFFVSLGVFIWLVVSYIVLINIRQKMTSKNLINH